MDKQAFYQREDVVNEYEAWRFGSAGGRYVDEIERASMLRLLAALPRDAKLLDIPCGTGRLLQSVLREGFTGVVGADSSQAMLDKASHMGAPVRLADAFAMPFEAGAMDVVCSLRFLFHVDQPQRFFSEVHRVLAEGGYFVFDSLNWTPRGVVPGLNRRLGGSLYCYRAAFLRDALGAAGFEVLAQESHFVLPSMAYRFIPDALVLASHRIESIVPTAWLSKTFYLARKLPLV